MMVSEKKNNLPLEWFEQGNNINREKVGLTAKKTYPVYVALCEKKKKKKKRDNLKYNSEPYCTKASFRYSTVNAFSRTFVSIYKSKGVLVL